MTENLPHFLPFRMAYEVNQNFPLAHLYVSRPDDNLYTLRIEFRHNHPIYDAIGLTIKIDMDYVQTAYSDPELCVIELLDGVIHRMVKRLRAGTSTAMLQEYAPWMFSTERSFPYSRIPPTTD